MTLAKFLTDGNLEEFLTGENSELKYDDSFSDPKYTKYADNRTQLERHEWSYLDKKVEPALFDYVANKVFEIGIFPINFLFKQIRPSPDDYVATGILGISFITLYLINHTPTELLVSQETDPGLVDLIPRTIESGSLFKVEELKDKISFLIDNSAILLASMLKKNPEARQSHAVTVSNPIQKSLEEYKDPDPLKRNEVDNVYKVKTILKTAFLTHLNKHMPKLKPGMVSIINDIYESYDTSSSNNEPLKDFYNTLMRMPIEGVILYLAPSNSSNTNARIGEYDLSSPIPVHKLEPLELEALSKKLPETERLSYINPISDDQIKKTEENYKKFETGELSKKAYIDLLWADAFEALRSKDITTDDVVLTCNVVMVKKAVELNDANVYNLLKPICTQMETYRTMTFKRLFQITSEVEQKNTYKVDSGIENFPPSFYVKPASFEQLTSVVNKYLQVISGPEIGNLVGIDVSTFSTQTQWNPEKYLETLSRLGEPSTKLDFEKTNAELAAAFQKYKVEHPDSKFEIANLQLEDDPEKKAFNEFLIKTYGSTWFDKLKSMFSWGYPESTGLNIYPHHTIKNKLAQLDLLFQQLCEKQTQFEQAIGIDLINDLFSLTKNGINIKHDSYSFDTATTAGLQIAAGVITASTTGSRVDALNTIWSIKEYYIPKESLNVSISKAEIMKVNLEPITIAKLIVVNDNTAKTVQMKILEHVISYLISDVVFGVLGVGLVAKVVLKLSMPDKSLTTNIIPDFLWKYKIIDVVLGLISHVANVILTNGNSMTMFNPQAYFKNDFFTFLYSRYTEEVNGVHSFPFFKIFIALQTFCRLRNLAKLFWRNVTGRSLTPRRGLPENVDKTEEITLSLLYVIWLRDPALRQEFYNFSGISSNDKNLQFASILNFNVSNLCPIECKDHLFQENTWSDSHGNWVTNVASVIPTMFNPLKINVYITLAVYVMNCLVNGTGFRKDPKIPIYNPVKHKLKGTMDLKDLITDSNLPYHKFINYMEMINHKDIVPIQKKLENNAKLYSIIKCQTIDTLILNDDLTLKKVSEVNADHELVCVVSYEDKIYCKFEKEWYLTDNNNVTKVTFSEIRMISIKLLMFRREHGKKRPNRTFSEEISKFTNKFQLKFTIPNWIFKPHNSSHTSCLFEALSALYVYLHVHTEKSADFCVNIVKLCKTRFASKNKIPEQMLDDQIAVSPRDEIKTIFFEVFKSLLQKDTSNFELSPVNFFEQDSPINKVMIGNPEISAIGVIPQMFDIKTISPFFHYVPLISKTPKETTKYYPKDISTENDDPYPDPTPYLY